MADQAAPEGRVAAEEAAAGAPAGHALLRAVAVMDQLRSPGGCPWDAAQTHASLAPYAVEEAHELAEVAETGDRDALVEELGDLLLQVLFHARVGAEGSIGAPFDIDDVATGLVTKLVRRHPHVFSGGEARTPDEVNRRWDEIKATEKPRSSVLDGIPASLPALARAQKVLSRAERAGIDVSAPATGDVSGSDHPSATDAPSAAVADELLAAVGRARAAGLDAEAVLRARTRELEAAVRSAETPTR